MRKHIFVILSITTIISTMGVGGCLAIKGASLLAKIPAKTAYKTGEVAGKGVYYTAKGASQFAYKTGEYSGKGALQTTHASVHITKEALDVSYKILNITTEMVDFSGQVITLHRTLNRTEAQAYIEQAQGAANVLSILVDIARDL